MSRSSCRLVANTTSRIPSSLHTNFRATPRPFSQTCTRKADSLLSRIDQATQQQQQQTQPRPTGPPRTPPSASSDMGDLQRILTAKVMGRAQNQSATPDSLLSNSSYSTDFTASADGEGVTSKQFENLGPATEPFHFHVYAHKHNCHITVTKPNRGSIVSLSAGNIGFRKAKRGSYDAAYQLTAYVMDKLNQGGWHKVIRSMEVVLRGFGSGREAATKVLLGAEGKMLRHTISKVSDATRLKFGGTRSPKPRRLG